jgi:hypothetical protein
VAGGCGERFARRESDAVQQFEMESAVRHNAVGRSIAGPTSYGMNHRGLPLTPLELDAKQSIPEHDVKLQNL